MPSKTEEYLALAQRTANGLTRYWESWTDYLTTASRLYKYSFPDQLMIYAQRPDATAFKNEHQAVLRAELSYPVSLGDDARGNITRLDNAIDNFADRIADAENALQNLEQQKQAAEVEVAKPFAQEEELAEKSARLAELNALLNIDRDRSSSQDAPEETEETETPATRPSVLAALGEKTNQPEPVKPFRSYYDKDGDAR